MASVASDIRVPRGQHGSLLVRMDTYVRICQGYGEGCLTVSDRQALYPAEVLSYQARAKGLAFLGIVSQIATLINTFGYVGLIAC